MEDLVMDTSWLDEDGGNIFIAIKALRDKRIKSKKKVFDISIGEPSGAPLRIARRVASRAILSNKTAIHGYQDTGERGVPGFSKRFTQIHVETDLDDFHVDYAPIVGIKPTLLQVLLARNCFKKSIKVGHMTNPGYPVPKTMCQYLKIENNYSLQTNINNRFLPGIEDIKKGTNVLMFNLPHNPSGQIATADWWHEICAYCEEKGISVVNDGAYNMLNHSNDSSTLADVAIHYRHLPWIELNSASKPIGNTTGWRIGAAVGSPKFIEDLKKIKGNIDSGFCAALAKGVLAAVERDKRGMIKNRIMYADRLNILMDTLGKRGMKPAYIPQAGFFALYKRPKIAFNTQIHSSSQFNELMIENTGVVGVPFDGDTDETSYIRYAVASSNIGRMKKGISTAFQEAQVAYA